MSQNGYLEVKRRFESLSRRGSLRIKMAALLVSLSGSRWCPCLHLRLLLFNCISSRIGCSDGCPENIDKITGQALSWTLPMSDYL